MQIHVTGIHPISAVSLIERLSLKEFTLWGRDLVSVVHIRENLYYSFFFLQKIYENFVGTLQTVCNRLLLIPFFLNLYFVCKFEKFFNKNYYKIYV